jgi:hypothetical protein
MMPERQGVRRPSLRRSVGLQCVLWALLIACCASRSAAAAEARDSAQPDQPPAGIVRVTAGEHGDFSRIVFAIGAVPSYRGEPRRDGLQVQFPGSSFEFDFSAAAIAARTRRVIAARAGDRDEGAAFDLSFNCNCVTKTFVYEGKLVVDVFGRGEALRNAVGSIDAGTASGSNQIVPTAAAQAEAAPPVETAEGGGRKRPRPEFVRRVEQLAGLPGPIELPQPRSGEPPFDHEHLREMMAWAIDQGHLTAAHAADAAASARESGPGARESNAPGNSVPGGMDDGLAAASQDPAITNRKPASECPENAVLDATQRSGRGGFAQELARRQEALSRALALGEGLEEAQLALAGFYLARLMPQETLGLLRGLDAALLDRPDAVWLKAAALLLAGRADEIAPTGWRSRPCSGTDVAVWRAAIVAGLGGPVPQLLISEEIFERLGAYPAPLRIELSLRLAEAGVDARATEHAGRLLQIVESAEPQGRALARALFLKGRLATQRGDFAGAREHWQQAARLPGEYGTRAELALLRGALEEHQSVAEGTLPLLERLAFDWRGHDLQLEIARLAARLLEREGRPLVALRMLEGVALSASGKPDGRAAARLATNLLRRLYTDPATPPGPAQLSAFWRYEGFVPPGPDGADIRLEFARALVAHDLPGPAVDILQAPASGPPGVIAAEATTLLAKARLLLGQAQPALDLLRWGAGRLLERQPERDALAARALATLGRFAEAAGVLDGRATTEAMALAADYLWDAGLWNEAIPIHLRLLEQAREAGDEETARRVARRATAAAYMADGAGSLGPARKEALAAISDSGETAVLTALLDKAPAGAGLRARASILAEQAARLAEFARTVAP